MSPSEGGLPAATIAAAVASAAMFPLEGGVAEKFATYYELLEHWNSRLNLTAIRDPKGVLRRHFLECIFCALNLPKGIGTLLDYGSGAGFPGIPIALCRPEIRVTLAESQGKKASFLREVVRTLGIEADVHAGRVEKLPADRQFDAVTLRAVDKMAEAIAHATSRVAASGWLVVLASQGSVTLPGDFQRFEKPVPGSENGAMLLAQRPSVSRGTGF